MIEELQKKQDFKTFLTLISKVNGNEDDLLGNFLIFSNTTQVKDFFVIRPQLENLGEDNKESKVYFLTEADLLFLDYFNKRYFLVDFLEYVAKLNQQKSIEESKIKKEKKKEIKNGKQK